MSRRATSFRVRVSRVPAAPDLAAGETNRPVARRPRHETIIRFHLPSWGPVPSGRERPLPGSPTWSLPSPWHMDVTSKVLTKAVPPAPALAKVTDWRWDSELVVEPGHGMGSGAGQFLQMVLPSVSGCRVYKWALRESNDHEAIEIHAFFSFRHQDRLFAIEW